MTIRPELETKIADLLRDRNAIHHIARTIDPIKLEQKLTRLGVKDSYISKADFDRIIVRQLHHINFDIFM